MKKKRGRPRKNTTEDKPKAKRGRPRKLVSTEEQLSAPSTTANRGKKKPVKGSEKLRSATAEVSTSTSFSAPMDDPVAMWKEASALSRHISDHYSMREGERILSFAYALTLPKQAVMVEIGVTHGKTAALLAYAAKRKKLTYVGVDNFTVENNAENVEKTLSDLDLPYTLLVGDSATVPFKKQIDYLLIDGGHDLFNIKADCERWLPQLKQGGLVLFHEFNKSVERGDPHWYVYHFAQLYTKDWHEEDLTPNLVIRRKPL